jgi:hypothetical protein
VILTEIPLKLPIAAVSDGSVGLAARAVHAVVPADLLEQVGRDRFILILVAIYRYGPTPMSARPGNNLQ